MSIRRQGLTSQRYPALLRGGVIDGGREVRGAKGRLHVFTVLQCILKSQCLHSDFNIVIAGAICLPIKFTCQQVPAYKHGVLDMGRSVDPNMWSPSHQDSSLSLSLWDHRAHLAAKRIVGFKHATLP